MNIRLDLISLYEMGINEHPQKYMKRLGITYKDSTPQSMTDEWWFFECENVPDPFPDCFRELKTDQRY